MASVNEELRDLLLRRAVRRVRYENATVRDVLRRWRRLERDVQVVVRGAPHIFTGVRRSVIGQNPAVTVAGLVTEVARLLGHHLTDMIHTLGQDLPALARTELTYLPAAVQAVLDRAVGKAVQEAAEDIPLVSIAFNQVPIDQAAELIAGPLGGVHYAQSFSDLAAATLRSLRTSLVSSLVRGQTVPQATRAVRQVLNNRRFEAERIVRSEFVRVGNEAALATYEQNKEVLQGVQWLATLDKRTCPQCGVLDGKVWDDPSKARRPVTDTHPLCRCTLLPVVKSSRALGITNPTGTTRSSLDGQVAATTTYPDWFGQQDAAFQREVLGPTRYKLFRSGKATIKDFAGTHGAKSVRDVLRGLAEARA